MKTSDFRALAPRAQQDLRVKAVQAVAGGMTQVAAAKLFGVTRQAVGGWMKLYAGQGAAGLRAKPRGRPKGGLRLKPWQAAQIAKTVVDRRPDQLKLPFYLWTRAAVGDLIARRFGVGLSVWTIGRYLARWGLTPQRPVKRAFERDPEAVRAWLAEEYPAIRAAAKRQKALIYWADEMGLRSDHATGTTYGRRGRTPAVPAPGRRFGCQMISAITNRGELAFMVFRGRFHTPVFLEFLQRLLRHAGRRAFLIADSHPVHRAGAVRRWLAAQAKRLQLFYLPGYSPELNPDEYLNNDVKGNAVGRRRARNQGELMASVRAYLRSTQKQPAVVRRYFEEEHVRYAAM
jgi:transposase